MEISSRLQEIINGSLLGDGYISKHVRKVCNSNFRELHCPAQLEYLYALAAEFGEWGNKVGGPYKNSPNSLGPKGYHYEFASKRHIFWNNIRDKWYPNGIKTIPHDLILTPLTLAHWFCGDGDNNIRSGRARISTNGFTLPEHEMLKTFLKEHLNIESYIARDGKYYRLHIRRYSYLPFMEMIKPHIPYKCFQYKVEISKFAREVKINPIKYQFIDPNGILHETENLTEFAAKHKFTRHDLSHNKWQFLDSNGNAQKIRKSSLYSRAIASPLLKKWQFIDPSGNLHETKNLTEFAVKHNLSRSSLSNLGRGFLSSTEGWTLPNHPLAKRQFIDPKGNIHETTNVTKLAKQHNLRPSNLLQVANRSKKSHKGWTLPQ